MALATYRSDPLQICAQRVSGRGIQFRITLQAEETSALRVTAICFCAAARQNGLELTKNNSEIASET